MAYHRGEFKAETSPSNIPESNDKVERLGAMTG